MNERDFDVIVMGAGPAGEVCAGRLGDAGLDVAIVEGHLVGGECSFYACMPSKALLRPLEVRNEAARVPGLAATPIDAAEVLARRDRVIANLDDAGQLPWLEAHRVTLVRGYGRLAGPRQVVVGEETLRARQAVVIATGSSAAVPPIPGLRESKPWTNIDVTTAKAVPNRMLILGGGVVGVEMAQAWASLGAAITLVHRGERVLEREEPFAGEQVRAALVELGADVRLSTEAVGVERNGTFRVALSDGDTIEVDELLVALGRRPTTDDIGLETVGLEPGGYIAVEDTMRVAGHDWLYVIGDANGRALLTHMGKYQGRHAADTILGRPSSLRSDGVRSPRVIFTDPQVGAVGYTVSAAERAGLEVRAVDVGTGANAGGSFVGRGAAGTSRLVVDEQRRIVVGATITGPEVAEALHAATIAVTAEVPLDDLWHAVPAFPTRSELWLRLLEAYGL